MRSKGKGKRELKGLLEGLDVGKRKRILRSTKENRQCRHLLPPSACRVNVSFVPKILIPTKAASLALSCIVHYGSI
jgi:hypothetical protein